MTESADNLPLHRLVRNALDVVELPTTMQGTPDAIRLLHDYADDLLMVRREGGTWRTHVLDRASGLWHKDEDQLRSFHVVATTGWMIRYLTQEPRPDAQAARQVGDYMSKGRTKRHQDEMLSQLGVAFEVLQATRRIPTDLTICDETDLDQSLRYIGTPGGALDLHTGRILPPAETRKLLITRTIPDRFDPDAHHPDVDQLFAFLDDDVRAYFLGALGYALRGVPTRRVYFMMGSTGGGKTTLVQAIKSCLGPYADTFHPQAITDQRFNAGSAGLSPELRSFMPPRRLAFSSDVLNPTDRLSTGRIKSLSGGDTITWRGLREDFRHQVATATIVAVANDLPHVGMADHAVLARAKILPWAKVPEDSADEGLADRLQTEPAARMALLAQIVAAGVALGDRTPADPKVVVDATAKQRITELGLVGVFLEDLLARSAPTDWVSTQEIWTAAMQHFGAKKNMPDLIDDGGRGMDRRGLTNLCKAIHDLSAVGTRTIAGSSQTGWRGWRLNHPNAPDDMQAMADRYDADPPPPAEPAMDF